MISEVFNKLSDAANHHQIIFGAIIGVSIICCSWGIEKLLEKFLFPSKPVIGYIVAIAIGFLLLWITKHHILHVI